MGKTIRSKRKAKMTQSTMFGEADKQTIEFVSRNKKIIKSQGLTFYDAPKKTPESIIKTLEEEHGRTKFYSLFSGGKDSMTTTHLLDKMDKLEAVVHIKTNIGLQMTTDFVKEICEEMNWKLYVIEPMPKMTYASHVLQYGFPGPGFHNMIMGKLKYKTMRDFALTINRKEHCLISGVRKFESNKRNANYPLPISQDGNLWFGCPIFWESTKMTYLYVANNNLRISPAYAKGLGTSGECMCGSFAKPHEKEMIRELDPKLADYISWLEEGIQKYGTPEAKKYPKWGMQPKMSELEEQQLISKFLEENPDLKDVDKFSEVTCGQECGPGSMRGETDWQIG